MQPGDASENLNTLRDGTLCPACAEKMRHAINPSNWPRMDPAVRQFAKKSVT